MNIRRRSPLNRPGTARHPKGMERLNRILDSARAVFMEEGYARFTMRKVAAHAGISIGNLSYYYRTREDLLRDLLEYVINGYLAEFERLRELAGASPEDQLAAVLHYWMSDLGNPATTRFFPELWAMANHDAHFAELVDELYKKARLPLNELIPQINPGISENERERIALYMCATMEGLTVFAGHGKPWSRQLAELEKLSMESFLRLIRSAGGT